MKPCIHSRWLRDHLHNQPVALILMLLLIGAPLLRAATAGAPVYQINCGGPAVEPFAEDGLFTGGQGYSQAVDVDASGVANPPPQEVYQSVRALYEGSFGYSFPELTPGGSYLVRLHFADIFSASPGDRIFNVTINGTAVLTNFDVIETTGAPAIAVVREFTVAANAVGKIDVQFSFVKDSAIPAAIEIFTTASELPAVALASPADETFLYLPGDLTLQATASATVGTIVKVEYFQGDVKLGEAAASPFAFTWSSPAPGDYTLTAKATDNSGRIGTSSGIHVKVIGPGSPIYQINCGGGQVGTFEADAYYAGGQTVQQEADVDLSGAVNAAPLEVYKSIRALFEGSFSYTFPKLTPGAAYTVRLHFADIFSAEPGVRVFNVDINASPVLSNFDVIATAGAPNVAVVRDFTIAADSAGQITVGFRAVIDSAIPSAIEVLASSNTAPVVLFTSPTAGSTSTFGSSVALRADANISGESISKVEFFSASEKVGEAVTAPYTFVWTNAPAGTHVLTAKATSAAGSTSTSSGLSFTVFQVGRAYQINCGGVAVGPFAADAFFLGGLSYSKISAVETNGTVNAAPVEVYQTVRAVYEQAFEYIFPNLISGSAYTVRLHFADLFSQNPGDRLFNVTINENRVLENFDVIAEGGAPGIAMVKDFATQADAAGQIHILFDYVVDSAIPCAIEILGERSAPASELKIVHSTTSGIELSWTGSGATLQQAATVTGPWSTVDGAASPWFVLPSEAIRFFQLKQ